MADREIKVSQLFREIPRMLEFEAGIHNWMLNMIRNGYISEQLDIHLSFKPNSIQL